MTNKIKINTADILDQLHTDLDDALRASAPEFWQSAISSCHLHPDDYKDCEAYHRIWQYLVLWRFTTSMRPESSQFIDYFRGLAAQGKYRDVFISATADYNMLAHILCAYSCEDADLRVTVFDLCETSLQANRWYADRKGAEIDTQQGNILNFRTDRCYDVICSHSLFLWLPIDEQEKAVATWYELLRPGGIVVTSTRLYSGTTGGLLELTADEALDFRERVYSAAGQLGGRNDPDPGQIADIGYEYMTTGRTRYIVNDVQIYREMFERAGFTIETMTLDDDSNERVRPTGPKAGSIGRLHVIARKS